MQQARRIISAARGLLGVPFRLHGRDPATGLDCIGLVLSVLERAGHRSLNGLAPEAYSIRGGSIARFATAMLQAGLRPARMARAGDVVLVQAGPAQFHLMIATDDGHVHAHAGLGHVVEMPGASTWPVLGRWRWGR